MIIGGTKLVEGTVSSGRFYCPKCQREESYQIKNVRLYAHVFWIPIFSTQNLGDKLSCFYCNSYYPLSKLNDPDFIVERQYSGLALGNVPANFGKRMGAFLLDMVLLYMAILFTTPVGFSSLNVLFPLIYFLLCDFCFQGASLGKKIMSIEITDRDEEESVTPVRIVLRNVIKCLSLILPFLYLVALFNERKMALHDHAGKTMVVERR